MWRELVEGLSGEATFGDPADDRAIAVISERLGQEVPGDLAALLREVGSIQDEYGTDVVWSADRIADDNAGFRSEPEYEGLYMPFEPLMFFGDAGDGNQFAIVRRPRRPDVFVWDHESDGRWWIASGLEDFLTRYFRTPDWYKH